MVKLIANAIAPTMFVYRFPRIYTKRISVHERIQTWFERPYRSEWCARHTIAQAIAVDVKQEGNALSPAFSQKVRSPECRVGSSQPSNGCHKISKIHSYTIQQSEIFYTHFTHHFYLRRHILLIKTIKIFENLI